jgi:hypothetical protein
VKSEKVAVYEVVLGKERFSSASSFRKLSVHLERGCWLRVLFDFGLPPRKKNALIDRLLWRFKGFSPRC